MTVPAPHPVRRASLRTTTTVLAATLVAAALIPGAAHAADGVNSAPVTAPDRVSVFEGSSSRFVDLVANDTDADGDALAVCRFGDVPDGLYVERLPDFEGEGEERVVVAAFDAKPGTYEVTYYACDLEALTPGTLTVKVTKAPPTRVIVRKLPRHPGQLRVVNNSRFKVRFTWGSYEDGPNDGHITVGAKGSRVISVRRRSITWFALNPRRGAVKVGFVRGIGLPEDVELLPPGAPLAGESVSFSFLGAGRGAAGPHS